jgi:pimeloyl-ACP methyl ester carboxylesterase
MNTVTSADGTTIAFDRAGHGPALIIIGGGPTTRSAQAPLAALLAPQFTVYNYDRRGHGESGDTAPYATSREYEDLEAIIDVAGGTAYVYGTSGGGILALQAAAHGLAITKLAVWEPPYIVPNSRPPVPADYPQRLAELLAEGRRGDMLELFFTAAVGMPAEFVAPIRQSPFWAEAEKVAHTLIYDALLTGDFSIPTRQMATVVIPTLVIDGATTPWLTDSAQALAAALPAAERRTLTGQPHNVDAAAIAPVLAEYFAA